MDHATALALVNVELARLGRPPIDISEQESQRAFQSLRAYAVASGRPLELAIRDTVRFQIRNQQINARRSN